MEMKIKDVCSKNPTFVLSLGVFSITFFLILAFLPNRHGLELLLFYMYMTVACTFLPLPTPQLVILIGPLFNPYLIAVVGGIGTCLGTLIDYGLFSYALRYEKISKFRNTRIYKYCVRFFRKIAFITLVISAFTPIPFDLFRFLVISMGYNKLKYVLAVFCGRAPRYFLLAKVDLAVDKLPYYKEILFGSLGLMIVIALGKDVFKRIKPQKPHDEPCQYVQNINGRENEYE